MSDIDKELESLSHDVFHPEALAEIARAKEKNPSMFVSGWIENDSTGVTEDTDIDVNPKTRLLWASEHGKRRIIREVLAKDPSLVNVRDRDGYTPLHRASYNDYPKTIKLLLSLGADINAKTNDGWQPLHCASRWGGLESVQVLLLDARADVNARTNGGLTPLHLAASSTEEGAVETAKYLLSLAEVDTSAESDAHETAADIARRNSVRMAEVFRSVLKTKPSETVDSKEATPNGSS